MKKVLKITNLIFILVTLLILAVPTQTSADVIEQQNMEFEIGYTEVNRVEVLEKFFEKYNSPLKESSETFVAVADKYGIDYTILPSISCMESTCGRFLIEGSYNPFGWGVYGNQYIAFESYDHAIEEVGAGLYEGYFSKGADTLWEIAPIYTPPNSTNWYRGVSWFEDEIQKIALDS